MMSKRFCKKKDNKLFDEKSAVIVLNFISFVKSILLVLFVHMKFCGFVCQWKWQIKYMCFCRIRMICWTFLLNKVYNLFCALYNKCLILLLVYKCSHFFMRAIAYQRNNVLN